MNRPPSNDPQGVIQGVYGQQFGRHWRARERAFPTDSDPACLVFEYFSTATGWAAVFAFRPDGKIVRASDSNIATFAPEPP